MDGPPRLADLAVGPAGRVTAAGSYSSSGDHGPTTTAAASSSSFSDTGGKFDVGHHPSVSYSYSESSSSSSSSSSKSALGGHVGASQSGAAVPRSPATNNPAASSIDNGIYSAVSAPGAGAGAGAAASAAGRRSSGGAMVLPSSLSLSALSSLAAGGSLSPQALSSTGSLSSSSSSLLQATSLLPGSAAHAQPLLHSHQPSSHPLHSSASPLPSHFHPAQYPAVPSQFHGSHLHQQHPAAYTPHVYPSQQQLQQAQSPASAHHSFTAPSSTAQPQGSSSSSSPPSLAMSSATQTIRRRARSSSSSSVVPPGALSRWTGGAVTPTAMSASTSSLTRSHTSSSLASTAMQSSTSVTATGFLPSSLAGSSPSLLHSQQSPPTTTTSVLRNNPSINSSNSSSTSSISVSGNMPSGSLPLYKPMLETFQRDSTLSELTEPADHDHALDDSSQLALELAADSYILSNSTSCSSLSAMAGPPLPISSNLDELVRRFEASQVSPFRYLTEDDDSARTTSESDSETRRYQSPLELTWQRGDLLGQGAFGKVYRGLLPTGEFVAVKQVELDQEHLGEIRALEKEVRLLSALSHPNIVRYITTQTDQANLYILLEYVPGGSIASLLSKFGLLNVEVVSNYTRQILAGLVYLHDNNIVHLDIKGANILVDNNGVIKLADFGASGRLAVTYSLNTRALRGTPYWMAPEIIRQETYGKSADIWSLGCTVVEMLTGKPPWCNFKDYVPAMFHIATSSNIPDIPESLSAEGRNLLLQCFQRIPEHRPTAAMLITHDFVRMRGRSLHRSSSLSSHSSRALPIRSPSSSNLAGISHTQLGRSPSTRTRALSNTDVIVGHTSASSSPSTPTQNSGFGYTTAAAEEQTGLSRRHASLHGSATDIAEETGGGPTIPPRIAALAGVSPASRTISASRKLRNSFSSPLAIAGNALPEALPIPVGMNPPPATGLAGSTASMAGSVTASSVGGIAYPLSPKMTPQNRLHRLGGLSAEALESSPPFAQHATAQYTPSAHAAVLAHYLQHQRTPGSQSSPFGSASSSLNVSPSGSIDSALYAFDIEGNEALEDVPNTQPVVRFSSKNSSRGSLESVLDASEPAPATIHPEQFPRQLRRRLSVDPAVRAERARSWDGQGLQRRASLHYHSQRNVESVADGPLLN
ncbi:STE/STE11 protein kinase [Capsaspora owczarzaki ATCC 30864]|uniref:STE/STE11 protein kinase n=2 Tax=Capsaspora owczarzaki (strain ATCC 30864) TaxID=595528 RepID=A0A0D2WMH3_CAPO3|nr:STE/STE11 protein kinase [Capsaspora owczarzaki ATCC 30864]